MSKSSRHPPVVPAKKFFRFLDTNGDGTGTKSANVNGSVTPVEFKLQPAAGEIYYLHRMIAHITDGALTSAANYGDVAGPLANGLTMGFYNTDDDSLILDILNGIPIKSNADWSIRNFDLAPDTFAAGNRYVSARWSFDRSGGPISLTEDEYLKVIINDDLTGLVSHYFNVQGEMK